LKPECDLIFEPTLSQKKGKYVTLRLVKTRISFRKADLFRELSLTIKKGEITTIMGPSGCGKSTLLSAVCGNLAPDFKLHGDILLEDTSVLTIPMEERRIGILFQDDLLFPHMNIAKNLGFAIPGNIKGKKRNAIIHDVLESAGLEGFYHRDPSTLSGGQRARVSLMRSLLAEPKAILLDEPFSKLDQKLKSQMRDFVFKHIKKKNIPALLVTHDPDDSADGRIIEL